MTSDDAPTYEVYYVQVQEPADDDWVDATPAPFKSVATSAAAAIWNVLQRHWPVSGIHSDIDPGWRSAVVAAADHRLIATPAEYARPGTEGATMTVRDALLERIRTRAAEESEQRARLREAQRAATAARRQVSEAKGGVTLAEHYVDTAIAIAKKAGADPAAIEQATPTRPRPRKRRAP